MAGGSMRILEERYARGEIDAEEFERRRATLEGIQMRIMSSFLIVALALVGLMGAACGGGGTARSPAPAGESPRVGDPAPAFSLPSAQGRTVSLGEFRGRKP